MFTNNSKHSSNLNENIKNIDVHYIQITQSLSGHENTFYVFNLNIQLIFRIATLNRLINILVNKTSLQTQLLGHCQL